MKEKKETSNKEIKDSEQAENKESEEIENIYIPGKCPKCGSEDVEYSDDDDSDSLWDFPSQTQTLYTYEHFICNVCKCKSTDVYINEYSHTEIDDDTNN